MKIKAVDVEYIMFDNGTNITFDHCADCCEYNYADFMQIEDEALSFDFEEPLDFEVVELSGFRFGNKGRRMFFIPCYSDQNGYYSSDVQIYCNGNLVVDLDETEIIG